MSSATNRTIGESCPVLVKPKSTTSISSSFSGAPNETAPKRIQALFGLLRDIQQNDAFREKYGKERSKEIISGIQKRLLAARDESVSLVFGSGKLGNVVGGEESSLNQTLRNIEVDLQALRRNNNDVAASGEMTASTPSEAVEQTVEPAEDAVAGRKVVAGSLGAEEIATTVDEESSEETSSEDSETAESSTSVSRDEKQAQMPIQETPSRPSDSGKASKHAEQESKEANVEDAEELLAKERKRTAHLEYLNKALESKVKTIEAEKLEMKEQLADRDGGVNDQKETICEQNQNASGQGQPSPNQTGKEELEATLAAERKRIAHLEYLNKSLESKVKTIEAQKDGLKKKLSTAASSPLSNNGHPSIEGASDTPEVKALNDKLQQSTASLDIFKVEAANLHQEILQLRKKVNLLTEEADRKGNAESGFKTLNRELEQQLTKMAQDKACWKKALENEKAQQKASKLELEKLSKSKKALAQQLGSLEVSHATEIRAMAEKLQSNEKALACLQEELAQKEEDAETALRELHESKNALAKDLEAHEQEIRNLKETIHHQHVSIQSAEVDHQASEKELRGVILQQRNDLKTQSESLKNETARRCGDSAENLKREQEKAESLRQKHFTEITELEGRHLEQMREQELLMQEKQAGLNRLLEQSRELNNQLELKLQKSREDNARCLSLVVKLGKQNLGAGESEAE